MDSRSTLLRDIRALRGFVAEVAIDASGYYLEELGEIDAELDRLVADLADLPADAPTPPCSPV